MNNKKYCINNNLSYVLFGFALRDYSQQMLCTKVNEHDFWTRVWPEGPFTINQPLILFFLCTMYMNNW